MKSVAKLSLSKDDISPSIFPALALIFLIFLFIGAVIYLGISSWQEY